MDGVSSISGSGSEISQTLTAPARRLRPQHVEQGRQTSQADRDSGVDEVTRRMLAADDAARQLCFSMLLKNGISPAQFRRDLLASLRGPKDHRVDRGKLLQSVPAGVTVDATA